MTPGNRPDEPSRTKSAAHTLDAQVAIASDGGPEHLLDAALTALAFPPGRRSAKEDSSAVILLDLGAFEVDSPVLPNRTMVEHLIDGLAALGWSSIAIASTADSSSTWAENREFPVLADLFGYTYETAAGTPYDIVDLSENLIDGGFPPGSALAGSPLSANWKDADLRIVVAKACTDPSDVLTLAAHTLLAALPSHDKDLAYGISMDVADAVSLLLDRAAPDLTIIDLCGVACGSAGRAAPQRADTQTIVAARDLLAADAAAAAKMGADPAKSPLWADLATRHGLPVLDVVLGDLAPLPGIRLPDPAVVDSTRRRDRSPIFRRMFAPWVQQLDPSLFPFKNPIDAKVHDKIAARYARLDDDSVARAGLLLANQLCVAFDFALRAWRVNHDKERVPQHRAGISPETLRCTEADYREMETELEGLKAWLAHETTDPSAAISLRWRKLNGAVVFSLARDYPVSFAEFNARIDISHTIQLMNDYVGGTIQVLERDKAGRPRRQVERNLYLPQPNYLAWWGGKEIDVSKIESVHYARKSSRMYWKTIKSENDSATYDDGVISFEAVDGGTTRVTVLGRQLFAVPPLIEAAHLDQHVELESHLIEHAYTTFFSRTFANFEALLEHRQITIGRPLPSLAAPAQTAARPIDTMADTMTTLADVMSPMLKQLVAGQSSKRLATKAAGVADADGFVHFRPDPALPPDQGTAVSAAAPSWWDELASGYLEAIMRDIGVRATAATQAQAGAA